MRSQYACAQPGHNGHPAAAHGTPQQVIGPQQQKGQRDRAHPHMLGEPQLRGRVGDGGERFAMRPGDGGRQQRPAGGEKKQAHQGVAEHPRYLQAVPTPQGTTCPAGAQLGPAPLQHHRDGETRHIGFGGSLQPCAPPPMKEAREESRCEDTPIATQQCDAEQQARMRMHQRSIAGQRRMVEEARTVVDADALQKPARERDHTRVHPPSATSRNHRCVSSPRGDALRTGPRYPHRAGADVTPPSTTMR